MKVLLDTHTILWALGTPTKLPAPVSRIIADMENEVFVSAASAWEIATKVRIGKLPEAKELEREFVEAMADAGYKLLSIDTGTALRAGRLSGDHRDPFDRMLAAQALALDMPILGADAKLDAFGVRRIW